MGLFDDNPQSPRMDQLIKLSVVIISWNTCDLLAKCLASVARDPVADCSEIIVVDNASQDGSGEMVRTQFLQVRLIQNSENVGFARANNQAIREASGQYILLLNPDTEVLDSAISALVRYLDQHPTVGAVGPKMLNTDGTIQNCFGTLPTVCAEVMGPYLLDEITKPWGRLGKHFWRTPINRGECLPVERVSFACTLVRREVLQELAGLDEAFLLYSEDYDFFKRMQQAGWQVLFCPSASVIHHWGASSRRRSEWAEVQLYRSKRQYYLKHHGPKAEMALRLGFAVRFAIKLVLLCVVSRFRTDGRSAVVQQERLLRELLQPLPDDTSRRTHRSIVEA